MNRKYLNPNVYFNKLTRLALTCFSPIIALWEKLKAADYANKPLMHQPVFIIGAPRTGSTILYQGLTNYIDVLYIDNLTSRLYKNFFFGIWLSRKVYKGRAHNNYKAEYGSTVRYGGSAPSECGEFWYRWMPHGKHFLRAEDLAKKDLTQIRKEITGIINYHNKPIVFKNMNAGLRMQVLSKIFPDAKFIWIKRNPLYVSQSLLEVRKKINGNFDDWWSLMPKNYTALKEMDSTDQVVGQIYSIEKQINEDCQLFPNENTLILDYEELRNYGAILKKLHKFVGAGVGLKKNFIAPKIVIEEKNIFKRIVISKLKNRIEELDWHDYKS
ncbi:MAG: sulfotransferase [Colwellia sp.]|jgi:Sulfotransferase domain.